MVPGTYGPDACGNWEIELEMIGLVTCFSRSASVTVKFGIKAISMLSSLALALVIVSGCTEDTPTEPAAKPAGGAVTPPAKTGGPAGAPAPAPTKPADEPKK
jgi:hypothetical protein